MRNKERVFLSSPHLSGFEMKYIKTALDQNWVAPLGPNVDAFERNLENYCGVGHVAALSSGTAAIHLALILLGVVRGDEVIAPTFTFSATINPIVYQGASPVLIDSEPETWNMDTKLLEKAILERRGQGRGHRLKAIIVVHLYGMPAKMEEIMVIANRYNIPVIEDAAEALGSKYKGRPLGSFGKFGILSFNGNKIITTSGGGALLSNDGELIDKARFLATQARDSAPHYQHSEIGYNYRLSNVLAGIGRGQMEVINGRVKRRREIFELYKENLDSIDGIEFLDEPDTVYYSNRWLTSILIDRVKIRIDKEAIQDKLEEENIESRPLWKPMHSQPVFSNSSAYLNGTAESLFERGLCLPSGSNTSDKIYKKVIRILLSSLESR